MEINYIKRSIYIYCSAMKNVDVDLYLWTQKDAHSIYQEKIAENHTHVCVCSYAVPLGGRFQSVCQLSTYCLSASNSQFTPCSTKMEIHFLPLPADTCGKLHPYRKLEFHCRWEGFSSLVPVYCLGRLLWPKASPTAPPDPSSGFATECFWLPQKPREQILSKFRQHSNSVTFLPSCGGGQGGSLSLLSQTQRLWLLLIYALLIFFFLKLIN